ncbi:MAG: arginine--tRNA ligase [Minisyncoccia bacterium]
MDPVSAIREKLATALKAMDVSVVPEDILLEHTADLTHGDYASNVAMVFAKQLKMNPRELAEKLAAEARGVEGVASVEVAGPGFINFTLAPEYLAELLEIGRQHGEKWGSGISGKGKKIILEFTDPNPFKEFHIGHLVPNAYGESISRLLEFSGADVKRANYQGDVGIHVAKSLFIQLEKGITDPTIEDLAVSYPEGSKRYEEDPAAKEAIDALNKKIYDNLSGQESDKEVNALYKKGRELSLVHFEKLYKILGTKFDFYFFESETGPIGTDVVRAHPEIFPESDGAVIFRGEEHGLHTRVFLNKLGLPTYEAKEIGLAKMKEDAYPFDLTITITGNEQAEYFKVVMKAMELALPELRGKLSYKTNGMLRFAEGKMSSRTGNIITGESLINDITEVAKERAAESRAKNVEKLAEEIAVAAIKFQLLKSNMGKDVIFDREQALSVEGDSGPYLQYTHARTHAIMEKAHEQKVKGKFDASQPASDLARLVYRFYETVVHAQEELEPHIVANYLIQVASAFNSWYAKEQILDGTDAAAHKVALTDIVRLTLKNGLWLLGIPAPEKV